MSNRKKVVLIKGDGIGPEIADAVVKILSAANAPIDWIEHEAGLNCIKREPSGLPAETLQAIRETGVALKGPTTTPSGAGHSSVNVALRKSLELYANIRPSHSLPGLETRYINVDLIIVRENVEDTYAGIEYMQTPDVSLGLKMISRPGSQRVCRYAFEMARQTGRKKVTVFHKANIHKLTDGLFLETFYNVAKQYPDVESSDILVDNLCMQLVKKPEQFDVLVGPNLYGDIVSDLCAGLVGGLGVAPGGNIGDGIAVFEAVHGSAPDIAGKGLANPTALLLSAIMMLEYIGEVGIADHVRKALFITFEDGVRTKDLGGGETTEEFTNAVIENLEELEIPLLSSAPPIRISTELHKEVVAVEGVAIGYDVFIKYNGGIPRVPKKIGKFKLELIGNRGTTIFPGPMPEVMLVDWYRLRYLSTKKKIITSDLIFLLEEFERKGYDIVQVVKVIQQTI